MFINGTIFSQFSFSNILEELKRVTWGGEVWAFCLDCCPCDPNKENWKVMDA